MSLAYAKDHKATLQRLQPCSKTAASGSTTSTTAAAIEVLLKVMRSDKRDGVAKSYDYMRRIGYFEPKAPSRAKSIDTV